nr:DUF1003 domain-containing protein [Maliibacterium massiliense]
MAKQEKMDRQRLVRMIVEEAQKDLHDEEVLHLILANPLAEDVSQQGKETFGMRAADKLARFAGSWTFVLIFTGFMIGWMILNIFFLANPYDPYPFILLNLVLSCVAAIQAPLIMMSQNRQETKDRLHAQNDYRVNLKTELIIQDLHKKMDLLLKNQLFILEQMERQDGQRN